MRTRITAVLATALLSSVAVAKNNVLVTLYSPSQTSSIPYSQSYNYGYTGYGYGYSTYSDPSYSTFGIVTERRTVNVTAGDNEIRFTDVPSQIDPTTVHFSDETDPGTTVTAQSYEYDLGTIDNLLAKYVGKEITVVSDAGEIAGDLVWYDATSLLVDTKDAKNPMHMVTRGWIKDIRFSALPGGVATKPTLVWTVKAKKAGDHVIAVTYQTRGISWSADYTIVLSSDEKKMEFGGWLSVTNMSGATFVDAAVRLVSGEMFQADVSGTPQYDEYGYPVYNQAASPKGPQRTYDVANTTTLEIDEVKQIELFAATPTMTGTRTYVYEYLPAQALRNYRGYGYGSNYPIYDQNADGYGPKTSNTVDVYLALKNTKANGLGTALPPGRLRVYKRADDDSLELLQDGKLYHTEKDADILVKLDTASDVVIERRQIDYVMDDINREIRERFEVKVSNTRKDAVEMDVLEHLFRWNNWAIQDESATFTRGEEGDTARFHLKVPAGGSETLTYTVVYQW